MNVVHLRPGGRDANQHEPSPADLAAIEREFPLIEAEMDLVAAEIRVLTADPSPSVRDWHRLRVAERRVLREAAALVARLVESLGDATCTRPADIPPAPTAPPASPIPKWSVR